MICTLLIHEQLLGMGKYVLLNMHFILIYPFDFQYNFIHFFLQSGNFTNPVYDSVFNGKSSSPMKDEKAVLLEYSADETPPSTTEEL